MLLRICTQQQGVPRARGEHGVSNGLFINVELFPSPAVSSAWHALDYVLGQSFRLSLFDEQRHRDGQRELMVYF
ncbi:hypothetical protein ACSZMQ_06190 [Aeromonas rivipollensis]